MITIEKTNFYHIKELREIMREDDVCEILKFGVSAKKALFRSWQMAIMSKTVLVDNEVAAIYGLGGVLLGQVGRPWLLTSPIVEKHYFPLIRIYRQEVAKMLEMFPVLENYCDSEYSKALRLLELVGFKLSEPVQIGKNKAMFRKFSMVANA